MADAKRDSNYVPTMLGVSSVDGITPLPLQVNPTTGRLLTDVSGGGSGTVTDVSVVTANGISGTVATSTTTPAITLTLGDIVPTSVSATKYVVVTPTIDTIAGVFRRNNASQSANILEIQTQANATLASFDKAGNLTATNFSGSSSGTNTGDNATNSSALAIDQTTPQTVINGKPIFSDGIKFGATPTVGSFANGKMYYDVNYKTMAVNIADDVNLQIGQEAHTFVKNITGSSIPNGSFVYINGTSAGVPTIALAKADSHSTSEVAGCTTQTIANGATGLITNRGEVHDVNTGGFSEGDTIYLSDTTAGAFTNTVPSAGSIKVKLGKVLEVDASTGEILVSVVPELGLGDLSNVVLTSPVLDETLRFNGTEWVNGTSMISAGVGISFFNASPTITAASTNNSFPIISLSKTPVTTAEQTITGASNSNTVYYAAQLYDTALGRTTIDAGVWDFSIYAAVNSVAGGSITSITRNVFTAKPFATGTVTTTGTGVTRTATASAGTPFATTDITASATNTLASYLQTPQGLYQISARTSDTVVTIVVPSTYTNESAVAGTTWKLLFGVTTPTITSTGTNYSLYTIQTTQPAFTISATSKLGSISFVNSNASRTVTTTYDGTAHNTHFTTPLVTLHNNLAGLQGGTSDQFYHLTSTEYTGTGTGAFVRLDSPVLTTKMQVPTIELGAATDTTIARVSAGVVSIEGKNILTTDGGTLTGSITLGENTGIALDPAGSADGKWSGITIAGVAGYAQTFGDLVYLAAADSRWEKTDADASATGGPVLIGMVVVAGAADGSACTILLQGQIRADSAFPALTIGAPVYLGETAGAIQTAIPTGADNVIRVVGFALTADEIYFNPSQDHQLSVA